MAPFTPRGFKAVEKLHSLSWDLAGFEGTRRNSFSLGGGLIFLTSEGVLAHGDLCRAWAEPRCPWMVRGAAGTALHQHCQSSGIRTKPDPILPPAAPLHAYSTHMVTLDLGCSNPAGILLRLCEVVVFKPKKTTRGAQWSALLSIFVLTAGIQTVPAAGSDKGDEERPHLPYKNKPWDCAKYIF